MKRRFILLAVATFLSGTMMAAWDGSTKTAPSAGDGSEGSPYQIKTEENLAWLANTSSAWGKHFIQTADLDLGNHAWTPIGNSTTKFTGSYNGGEYVISNLYYNENTQSNVGLFGYISGATLTKITIANGSIYGNGATGGICGYATNSTISYCANNSTIYGKKEQIGGVCGYLEKTTVTNCINYGLVSGFNFVGGVVGRCKSNNSNVITNCINVGQIFSMCATSGNIIGFNDNFTSTRENNYYDNQLNTLIGVTGYKNIIDPIADETGVAGLSTTNIIGKKLQDAFGSEAANWVFTEGLYPRINGSHDHSAIILAATPLTLESSDNADNVTKDFSVSTDNNVSWESGESTNLKVSGKSATILKNTGVAVIASKDGFTKKIFLKTNKPNATHIGSETAPLTIETEKDLKDLREAVNTYGTYKHCAAYDGFKGIHFKVTVDIELSDWTEPIGIHNSFKGIFDGNHRSINNVDINQSSHSCVGGLFGCASYGEIKNLTVRGSVIGNELVGGICGASFAETLTNCHSYCELSCDGKKQIGGITGDDRGFTSFINCENHGTITGGQYSGGIIGRSHMGTIMNGCKNYGDIIAIADNVGGMCGSFAATAGGGSINNCENHGDIESTGKTKIGGIVGYIDDVKSNLVISINGCINSGNITSGKHTGGIIGHNKDTINISNCLNIGKLLNGTENIGGIVGLDAGCLTLKNAFNAGKIDGAGIIATLNNNSGSTCDKCVNVGNSTDSKYCTYDYQMCPIGSSGKLTSEMLGNGLQNDLGTTSWVFTDGMYPMIKGLETSDYMIVAATPIKLNATEPAEKVNGVSKTLEYDKNSPVEWECSEANGEILVSFVSGKGYIANPSANTPVVLTATLGDAKKQIPMTIKTKGALTDPDVNLTLSPSIIEYGTPMSAVTLNATKEVAAATGDWEYSVKAGDILHAGEHVITATFIPTDQETYSIKTASAVLTVNKGDATGFITWEPATEITYGDEDSDSKLKNATATVDGKFYYDIPALTVGTHSLKLEFIGTNYEATIEKENFLKVTPATPAIAWAEPAAIDYGTPLSALQLGAVAGVEGTFTYYEVIDNNDVALPDDGILNAGTHTLKAVFDANSENYADGESMTVQLVVNKLKPVITWEPETAFAELNYGETLEENAFYASVPDEFNGKGNIVYLENDAVIDIYSIINAGTHTITAKFEPSDANYDTNTSTATIKVNKADPNVLWGDIEAITYGEKLSETQLNASSAAEGVEFSYTVTIGENTVPAMNAVLPAGDRVINAVLAESDNYNGWTGYKTIKVNAADLDIDWNPQGFTYGATAEEMASAVETAEISFNEQSLTEDDGTFIYTYPTPLNAGDNQSVSVKFVPNSTNFNTVEDTKQISIAKAKPEIVWVPQNVTYGASSEEIAGALENAEAKFNGVSVNGDYEYTLPLTTDLQAGADNITASVKFNPTGEDANNFSEVSATVNVVVDKADPTITWKPTVTEFTYGTELSDEQLNATANADGEIVYTDGETTIAAGDILDAGTHTITATLAESANYNEATATVTITVNAAETEITWETPAPIAYGTPISEIELNATANVDGTFAYTLNGENAEGQTPGIGSYSIVATFTPESSNYSGATATITLSVVSSAAEITWATPAAITYGTALGDAQLNATSEIEGNFYYTPASGAILPAGDSTLSVIFVPDSPDYGRAVASVKLTVNKAELKVSVADTTVKLGDEMPVFKLAYSGFVNNENESNLTVAPTATCAATTAEAGVFDIVVSGGESDNYNITYTNGKLTVADASAAAPVITWAEPAAITYGTLISADILNATVNAEGTFSYSAVKIEINELAFIPENAPTEPAYDTVYTTRNLAIGDTLNAGDYELIATFAPANGAEPITNTVKLTVAKATLTVSVADATVNQGDDMPSFSLDYKGFVLGETIADLTFIPRAKCDASTDNAGTFDIVPFGGLSDNYNFEYKNGKLTVKAKETAIAESAVKISVYPNPTADVFFVETEAEVELIYVYNMTGKLVLTETNVGKTRIDLANEPQGTYFVKVGEKTIKLLKF